MIMKVTIIYTFLLYYATTTTARKEWVDPYDLNIRTTAQREYQSNPNINNNPNINRNFNGNPVATEEARVLKELLSTVIDMTNFQKTDEAYRADISVNFGIDDYAFLTAFVMRESDNPSLRRVNEIIKTSFSRNNYSLVINSFADFIYFILYNEIVLLGLCAVVILFIVWKLQPHNYRWHTLIKMFVPLAYLLDFASRYIALIKEYEVDQYLESREFHKCVDKTSGGFFSSIYTFFFGAECEKDERKYLLSQRASYLIITPMRVISEQTEAILPAMKHFGEGCGIFMRVFTSQVPWYIQPIFLSVAFLVIITIILMVGTAVLGVSPLISICGLFRIEFKRDALNTKSEVLEKVESNSQLAPPPPALPSQHIFFKTKKLIQQVGAPSASTQKNLTYKTKARKRCVSCSSLSQLKRTNSDKILKN